jgi:hypothetical protein
MKLGRKFTHLIPRAAIVMMSVLAMSAGAYGNSDIGPSGAYSISKATVTSALQSMATCTLSDGRLQIFEIVNDGALRTRWKTSTAGNAPWTDWQPVDVPAPLVAISCGKLSDGAVQIFVRDVNGVNWTRWKTSPDPNATWTAWERY